MSWTDSVVTNAGAAILTQLIDGATLNITGAVISSNTVPAVNLKNQTSISSPIDVPVTISKKKRTDNTLSLTIQVKNTGLGVAAQMRQVGIYGKIGTGDSVLIVLCQNSVGEAIPPVSESPDYLLEFTANLNVSNTGAVTISSEPSSVIVTLDVLNDHITDQDNPHKVTKQQVGLGNVPNVSTNNQTPTYTAATDLTELKSGEKISVLFGKVAKAVSSLISHLNDNVRHISAAERKKWNGKTTTTFSQSLSSGKKIGTITVDGVAIDLYYQTESEATSEKAGLMSATDKTKLDGIDLSQKMDKNNPTGTGSFSIGRKINSDIGAGSIACGQTCTASGDKSQAFGLRCEATGDRACAMGEESKAQGHSSTAQGYQCTVDDSLGYGSHASGHGAVASGITSYAEGFNAAASGDYSCAIGFKASALGEVSFALGSNCSAIGAGSYAEGLYDRASGKSSFAQGYITCAAHHSSFAGGNKTLTGRDGDTVLGMLNAPKPDSLLTIGFGLDSDPKNMKDCPEDVPYNEFARQDATLKNVFRVTTTGSVYGIGAFNTSGADYAEYIKPWADNNAENEDRRGYFVTIKDGKLHKAEPDDYIVGITSGNPSVVGNGDEDWLGRWQRDEFNELIYKDVEVDDYAEKLNENGELVTVKVGSHIEKQTVQNPDYNPSQKYVERKDRSEWSCVGMIGVIPLRDDGTCVAGGFAKCGSGGVATKADSWDCHKTFFVIERINEHIISVEMR